MRTTSALVVAILSHECRLLHKRIAYAIAVKNISDLDTVTISEVELLGEVEGNRELRIRYGLDVLPCLSGLSIGSLVMIVITL